MYTRMNAIEHIRTRVFKLKQGPFAELAGVSQPTVSRWEQDSLPGSQPDRDEMERIRKAAIDRGLEWNDSWFFQTFPDDEVAA
jgi:DNA-binding transcriptional regulator YiaG